MEHYRAARRLSTRQLIQLDRVLSRRPRRKDPIWHADMVQIEAELCLRAYPAPGRGADVVARTWADQLTCERI